MKVAGDLFEVYKLRARLHKSLYQHHTANVAELMITDVLKLANQNFRFRGAGNAATSLADAALDPRSFSQLTDAVSEAIGLSLQPDLDGAAALLHRMTSRNFYTQVGSACKISPLPVCQNQDCRQPTPLDSMFCSHCGKVCEQRTMWHRVVGGGGKREGTEEDPLVLATMICGANVFKKEILELVDSLHKKEVMANEEKIAVHLVDISLGKKLGRKDPFGTWWRAYHPLQGVGFYNPKETGSSKDKVHDLVNKYKEHLTIPAADQERTLYLYLKENVDLVSGERGYTLYDAVHAAYVAWSRHCHVTVSQGGQNTPTRTPGSSSSAAPRRRLPRLGGKLLMIGHSPLLEEKEAELQEAVQPAAAEPGEAQAQAQNGESFSSAGEAVR